MGDCNFKICYVDDDADAIYSIIEVKDKLKEAGYKLEFISLDSETSKDEFLKKLYSNQFQGIILDYDLSSSRIYGNAIELWKTIKKQNPLFPVCIYTSHIDDVSFDDSVEKSFSKDSNEIFSKEKQIEDMVAYIDNQVKQGLKNIDTLKRVNKGLKTDETFSAEVMMNEVKIANQFSIHQQPVIENDDTKKLDQLICEAYSIIDKLGDIE